MRKCQELNGLDEFTFAEVFISIDERIIIQDYLRKNKVITPILYLNF